MIKKIVYALSALLILLLLVGSLALPAAEASCRGIYEKTLRLHVLANSDSEEDQALKLKVRDGLIAYVSPFLEDCGSAGESKARLSRMLDEIKVKAIEILRSEGSDDSVGVTLGKETFLTRDYGDFCYPAGDYEALCVKIGEGEGQNWWCVVFPPLCLDGAQTDGLFEKAGYTESEENLITKKDERSPVRFFLLDLAVRIRNLFFR